MDYLAAGCIFFCLYASLAIYSSGPRQNKKRGFLIICEIVIFLYAFKFLYTLENKSSATSSLDTKAALLNHERDRIGKNLQLNNSKGVKKYEANDQVFSIPDLRDALRLKRNLRPVNKSKNIVVRNSHVTQTTLRKESGESLDGDLSDVTKIPDIKKADTSTTTTSLFHIEAMSSKSRVYVSLHGSVIYNGNKSDTDFRGIHVVVMHEYTGVVLAHRVFDTYGYDDGELIEFFNSIADGRLVLFIVGDDGALALKKRSRTFLRKLGSQYAFRFGFRHTWVFACMKGQNYALAESYNEHEKPCHINFTQNRKERESCKWEDNVSGKIRERFCSKYDGFVGVCTCTNPLEIDAKIPLLNGKTIDLPIAVMASNRPHYLFTMLIDLMQTPGVNRTMVTVFIDGFFDLPAELAALFQLNYVKGKRTCERNCGIQQHYKRSLSYTFNKFQAAQYMIILEEDLHISRDIMDYFSQLLPVLATDESLYCISAWNDQAYKHSSNDPSMLYRVETMPGLGWVLKRKLFVEELEPKWPAADVFWDWDMWMRMKSNIKGRECIIPDISRTFHFGKVGVNMNNYFHELFFKNHALNQKTGVKFNITKVTKDGYELEMHALVKNAEVLDHSKHPCDKDFIPDTTNHTYVVYIRYENDNDYDTWIKFSECFRIWSLDVRGFHKRAFRLWIKQNKLIVVGSSSPYAVYKPNHVTPIFLPKKKPHT